MYFKISMHNHQHLKTNNISKLAVIALSIILLTGIFIVSAIQLGVYGQQQVPPQQGQIRPIQVIKQIAQQVATANPSTNATHVYQILLQLAKLTTQTSNQGKTIEDIRQISSEVTKYPFGTVSQSLAQLAQQLSASSGGNSSTNAIQVAQQITQEKSSTGQNISESIITKAVQTATGANPSNIKQLIRNAAQLLANKASVPVEKVEAVIIQIALQISKVQGKAMTAQSITQIVNQIGQNPNGVIAQAILKVVKQYADDNGKTGKMVNVIDNMIESGGGNNKTLPKMTGDRVKEGRRDGPLQPDECKKDPKLAGCQTTEPIPNPGLEPDDSMTPPLLSHDTDDGVSKASREDDTDDGVSKASREDDIGREASTTFSFDQNQKNKCSGFASCSNTATLIFRLEAQSHPD